jgi:heptosyltransferase-1
MPCGIDLPARPRFLITRLSALGDTVNTMPVATALRRAYPKSFIAWATDAAYVPLVSGHPAVNEVISVPRGFAVRPGQWLLMRRQLKRLSFDVAIDPQSLSKSSLVAWLSGASHRIGFAGPWGRELSPLLNNVNVTSRPKNAVVRYLKVLDPLGIKHSDVDFQVPQSPEAAESIDRLLRAMRLPEGFVLVSAGAGWDSKQWPVDRYTQLLNVLSQRRALPSVVVWGNDRERARAVEIVEPTAGGARLAPSMSLPELVELARRARFMLGSDTGPLHIAAAVGTPCVALFGPTDPELTGPYGSQHVIVQRAHEDLGSRRKKRGVVSEAMLRISVADVLSACDHVLVMPIRGRTHRLVA